MRKEKLKMKQCPYCGMPCDDGAKFCTGCGAQFIDAAAQQPAPAPQAPAYDPQQAYQQQAYVQQQVYANQAYTPPVRTKKEFVKLPENQKLRKQAVTAAIICYVCAGITLLTAIASENYFTILDVLILVGLGLGIHLTYSKGCGIALAIYSLVNVIFMWVSTGSPGGWLILLAGGYAIYCTVMLDRQWKEYRKTYGV